MVNCPFILAGLFSLALAPAFSQQTEVTVEVSDPVDQRVRRAVVALESASDSATFTAETDSRGLAGFEVAEGAYRVTVLADGFQLYELRTLTVGGSPVRLTIRSI